MNANHGRDSPTWVVALVCAGIALGPWLLLQGEFSKLYWFGDEWHLLLEIHQAGLWRWLLMPFAENFCPLFKVIWASLVYASNGSYEVMIAALWLTHALNVFLFGLVLMRVGFSRLAATGCMLVFALSWTNIESLGWSVQWSQVLAFSFLLAGVLVCFETWSQPSKGALAAIALCSLCSGLTFSRGVLSGLVLCGLALLPVLPAPPRQRLLVSAAALIPALICVACTIAVGRPSTSGGMIPHVPAGRHAAFIFSTAFFFLNPLALLFRLDGPLGTPHVLIAAIKVALIAFGLFRTREQRLALLLFALGFDLGNSVLLGLGRYWTGTPLAASSRYQYGSLICALPFFGIVLEQIRRALRRTGNWLVTAGATACVLAVAAPWRSQMRAWASWRGASTRSVVESGNLSRAGAPPAIPQLWASSPRELVEQFNLH